MTGVGRVLVTGAGGFIARHCIAELLDRGYTVTGTVRRAGTADQVRQAIAGRTDPGDRLSFATVDLLADAGWREAMAGCDAVLHVASPYPSAEPRDPAVLIRPAVEGTRRVIAAARAAGTPRLVLTSSVVAIAAGHRESRVYDESDWSDPDSPTISTYSRSKTLAERAAWEEADRPGSPALTVINPAQVFGPPLGSWVATSGDIVRLVLRSPFPVVPRYGFPVSDVRDVALAHVKALETPAAAGQRFVVADGFLWLADVARIVGAAFPAYRRRMPLWPAPNALVRLAAHVDPALRIISGDLGREWRVTSRKAETILGLQPRAAKEAVEAMAGALIAAGALG